MQIPGLTEQQITEMKRVVSVLIQKYAAITGEEQESVLSALTRVLNDLAQTPSDASLPTVEELIAEFNREHNRQSCRYSVVMAMAPFDLTREPHLVINTNKFETAMHSFQKHLSEMKAFQQQFSEESVGWLALISNEDRRIIGEVNL